MIQRRKPIARSTKPIKRGGRPRSRRPGPPRRGPVGIPAEEWRNPAYRAFLAEYGKCWACAAMLKVRSIDPGVGLDKLRAGVRPGLCDPAHGPVAGMSQKGPDCECSPLCRGFGLANHHDEQHAIGWPAFERKYGPRAPEAAAWWALFQITRE